MSNDYHQLEFLFVFSINQEENKFGDRHINKLFDNSFLPISWLYAIKLLTID